MKTYMTGRCGGKTTHMVKWLLEDTDRILITFSMDEAARIARHFKLSPCDSKRIMSAQHFLGTYTICQNIGVDNADIVLESVLQSKVELISITEEEE